MQAFCKKVFNNFELHFVNNFLLFFIADSKKSAIFAVLTQTNKDEGVPHWAVVFLDL